MKKFGTILLTIYLTITTIASAVFGYLYFKDRDFGSNDGDSLSISIIKTVVDDVFNTMRGKNNSSNLQSAQLEHVVYAAESEEYNVEQYFANNQETSFTKNDTVYKGLIYGCLLGVVYPEIAMNSITEYNTVYYDQTDVFEGYTDFHIYYTLERVSNMKSKLCVYITKVSTYNSDKNVDNIQFIIDKSDSNYKYVVEMIWTSDYGSADSSGTISQAIYAKFAKKNEVGVFDFEYCDFVTGRFNKTLSTILTKSQIDSFDLSNCEGGLYNIVTLKAKVGTQSQTISAINELKPYFTEYSSLLQSSSPVKTNFCQDYNNLDTSI